MSSGPTRGSGTSAPATLAQPVALGIHLGGGQPGVADREDPVEGPTGEDRRELFAPARAHRVAAGEDEGDVAAEAGGQLGELVAVEARGPRAGRTRRRAAAASAEPPAMPPATGMSLSMRIERHSSTDQRSATRRAARTARLSPLVGMRSAYVPAGTTCQSSQRVTETSSCSDTAW